jgi:hypothetical protein
MVEAIAWHTTPDISNKKYLMYYQMTLDAFNVLVEELTLQDLGLIGYQP